MLCVGQDGALAQSARVIEFGCAANRATRDWKPSVTRSAPLAVMGSPIDCFQHGPLGRVPLPFPGLIGRRDIQLVLQKIARKPDRRSRFLFLKCKVGLSCTPSVEFSKRGIMNLFNLNVAAQETHSLAPSTQGASSSRGKLPNGASPVRRRSWPFPENPAKRSAAPVPSALQALGSPGSFIT